MLQLHHGCEDEPKLPNISYLVISIVKAFAWKTLYSRILHCCRERAALVEFSMRDLIDLFSHVIERPEKNESGALSSSGDAAAP